MYGVLKLYFGLRAKCLWRMIKELKLLVIPVLLLFLLLGKLIVIDLVSAPIYYSILLYVSLLLARHFMRGDSTFLYSTFGKWQTKMLFLAEYVLLSIPFLYIFLQRGKLWPVSIVLLSLVFVCFVSCRGLSLRLPTFPSLETGSYEYHRGGRLAMLLFLPLVIGGAIGVYIGNRNLVIGVSMIVAFLFSMLMMRELYLDYLFNYRSALRFIKLKLLFALKNAFIIFLPFILCLVLVDFNLSQLFFAALYYLGVSFLLFQVEMLCFVIGGTNGGNDILLALAFIFLNGIFCVSLIVPQTMLFTMILSGVLAYLAYLEIKKYKL